MVGLSAPQQRFGRPSSTAQLLHEACLPALQLLLTAVLEVPAAAEPASPADRAVHLAAAEALLSTQRLSEGAHRRRLPSVLPTMHKGRGQEPMSYVEGMNGLRATVRYSSPADLTLRIIWSHHWALQYCCCGLSQMQRGSGDCCMS
jgi:hypothetical protein